MQSVMAEADAAEERRRWMQLHPVKLETIDHWEEWKPSVTNWFKTSGETEEEFSSRLQKLSAEVPILSI